MQRKA